MINNNSTEIPLVSRGVNSDLRVKYSSRFDNFSAYVESNTFNEAVLGY